MNCWTSNKICTSLFRLTEWHLHLTTLNMNYSPSACHSGPQTVHLPSVEVGDSHFNLDKYWPISVTAHTHKFSERIMKGKEHLLKHWHCIPSLYIDEVRGQIMGMEDPQHPKVDISLRRPSYEHSRAWLCNVITRDQHRSLHRRRWIALSTLTVNATKCCRMTQSCNKSPRFYSFSPAPLPPTCPLGTLTFYYIPNERASRWPPPRMQCFSNERKFTIWIIAQKLLHCLCDLLSGNIFGNRVGWTF